MSKEFPTFATNRADLNLTVGDAIKKMFNQLRIASVVTPGISIATAYINPAGYSLIADELNATTRVRLLIGAEPEFEASQAFINNDADSKRRLAAAIDDHDNWLKAERDATGFTKEALENAKAMVTWLRSTTGEEPKVEVRRYEKGFLHGKAYISEGFMKSAIAGSSNFTYAGLAKNAEINLGTYGPNGHAQDVIDWFEHYWEQSKPFDLASLYDSQWYPHEPWVVFARMLEELYGDHIDEEGATGTLGLTAFQRDGVARMRRLLSKNGGVLVADEVGLGKSFLAGELIKTAVEVNRQRVVIICPAALKESMWEPFLDQHVPSRHVKVYSFEQVRNKSDASKDEYTSFINEIEDYALVVVDEAHNLRNSGAGRSKAVDNLILSGKSPKQVVLLTATPVNNSLYDLETLVKYFIRNDAQFASIGIPSIREYIKRAQDMDPQNLTPDHLFDLMDQVAVRRTRKFVKDNYQGDKIVGRDGKEVTIAFPTPKSRRIDYTLSAKGRALVSKVLYALAIDENESLNSYSARKNEPDRLVLARYTSSKYLLSGDLEEYQIANAGLLRSAVLKRMESSPKALLMTLRKLSSAHATFIVALEAGYVITGAALAELTSSEDDDFMSILEDFDATRSDVRPAKEFDITNLLEDASSDLRLLNELIVLTEEVQRLDDPKFEKLVEELEQIVVNSEKVDKNGLSEGDRRKVIIFSSFADTVIDIHEKLTEYISSNPGSNLARYQGRIAEPILGAYKSTHESGASGGIDQGGRAKVLAGFAPKTAGELRDGRPIHHDEFDILITTDVLSEGVNLQQAGQIINYDLPWNPMRIVQRHGRIDRIGSEHPYVYLGLYFPNELLDEMLHLEETLTRKLAQAHAAVGEHIEVLSNSAKRNEVILADKSMEKMDELLESRGGSRALSGEEFRRRLDLHLKNSSAAKKSKSLPYGSGSGFRNKQLTKNAYVFCVKVAGHAKPWFRYVEATADWQVARQEGQPEISAESLVSLIAADPGSQGTPRELTDQAYAAVFDAWQVAQDDVFEKWTELTDPAKLAPNPPKSFRDAYALVHDHGAFLGTERQRQILARLNAVPTSTVSREVRATIDSGENNKTRIEEIVKLIELAGIQAPPPVEPLPRVEKHQVKLVCWMAVTGDTSI